VRDLVAVRAAGREVPRLGQLAEAAVGVLDQQRGVVVAADAARQRRPAVEDGLRLAEARPGELQEVDGVIEDRLAAPPPIAA